MPSLTVRRIPKDVDRRWKDNARRNNRSLNAEIVPILNDEDGWIGRPREIRDLGVGGAKMMSS